MDIELEKIRYPKANIKKWTHSAIHCYLRGCVCENCIYQESIKSTKCKIKVAVLLLAKKHGRPTDKKIKEYLEIEKGKKKYECKHHTNSFSDRCNEKNSTKRTRKKKKVLPEMD